MDIRKVMGANARRFRTRLKLSQEAVAERMGVDRAYVSAVERGVQNMTLLLINGLAEALDVEWIDLLDKTYAATVTVHTDTDS